MYDDDDTPAEETKGKLGMQHSMASTGYDGGFSQKMGYYQNPQMASSHYVQKPVTSASTMQ